MNTKQTVFVEEYLRCWNSSEAARRAGYNGKSNVIGPRLLADVSIKAMIDERLAELKMSTDEVLVRLAEQARGSHADFAEVNLREDLKDHPKAHLVKTIVSDVYEDARGKVHHKLRFELYDAQAALVHIGKAHGIFNNGAGESDDKPFIVKVVYGDRNPSTSSGHSQRANDTSTPTTPETSPGD